MYLPILASCLTTICYNQQRIIRPCRGWIEDRTHNNNNRIGLVRCVNKLSHGGHQILSTGLCALPKWGDNECSKTKINKQTKTIFTLYLQFIHVRYLVEVTCLPKAIFLAHGSRKDLRSILYTKTWKTSYASSKLAISGNSSTVRCHCDIRIDTLSCSYVVLYRVNLGVIVSFSWSFDTIRDMRHPRFCNLHTAELVCMHCIRCNILLPDRASQ